jgi:hypothetical protein
VCSSDLAKKTLIIEINKVLTNARYQNGTEDGVLDLQKGRNFTLSKTGKGLDTEYAAMVWPDSTAMEASWANAINVYKEVKKLEQSDSYLRSIIRNYLYGEPKLEPVKHKDEAETEAPTAKAGTGKIPNPKAAQATEKASTKRSLLEDTEDNIDNLK